LTIKAGAALGAAGSAVLLPLGAIFKETIGHFDDINKAADRLGTTTEILSALGYAAEQSGSNLEELEGSARFLQKALSAAVHEGGEAAEAFRILGLNAQELLTQPLDEQLAAVADALDNVSESSDRTALGMKVLGKSGATLFPLLKGGSGQLRDLMKEAAEVGAVVSGDQANQATRSGDAIQKVLTALKNTLRGVGAAFLPLVEDMERWVNIAVSHLTTVRQWIADNRQLVTTVAAVAAGLVAAGAALAGLGLAAAAIGAGIGAAVAIVKVLAAVVAAVVSPIGLAVAAIGGLGYVFATQTEAGAEFFSWIKGGFQEVAGVVSDAWGGIVAAVSKGDLALAGEIAVTAIELLWAKAVANLEEVWAGFKSVVVDGWHRMTDELAETINNFAAFTEKVFTGVSTVIGNVFKTISRTILDTAISIAKALDALDPTDSLQGAIETAQQLRAAIGENADPAERIAEIERDRAAIERQLREERTREEAAREAARAADVKAAQDKVAALEARLRELNAAANAPAPPKPVEEQWEGWAGEAARQISQAAGSRGTFSALQAAQFGGQSLSQKQMKAAEDTAKNTAATVKAVERLAMGLRFQ
jgi:hypothetical protein